MGWHAIKLTNQPTNLQTIEQHSPDRWIVLRNYIAPSIYILDSETLHNLVYEVWSKSTETESFILKSFLFISFHFF